MSIDPYSACPGGTGKKVKFCCQDLLNELGKIQQMITGNQSAACYEYASQLNEKYPERPCLMSTKSLMAFAARQVQDASETITAFVGKFPTNPVAKALQSFDEILKGHVTESLEALQVSLEQCTTEMPNNVYQAMKLVAQSLMNMGHVVPARGLMSIMFAVTQGQDESVKQLFMELETSAQIPVMLKDVVMYAKCDGSAPYKQQFDAALESALRGAWAKAQREWEAMLKGNGEAPAIWKNIAITRGYNADYEGSANAWRSFAELEVPQDEEIEAEALAQLFRRESSEGNVDDLSVTVAVKDYEQFEQKLLADKRAEKMQLDISRYADQGTPPPRAVFAIFDRAQVSSSVGLTNKDIPRIIGNLFLFGKETDRDARAEVDVYRTNVEALLKGIKDIGGDAVGEKISEAVEGSVSRLELALSWQWKLPVGTNWRERMRLMREQREEVILNIWPTLKLPLLDNMTPLEAAADWNKRDRLQAAIMLIEISDPSEVAMALFAKLRERLGLEPRELYDATNFDIRGARLSRFLYLDVTKCTDEQLQEAFERVMMAQFMPAARRLAEEIIKRGDALKADYRATAYHVLARVTDDTDVGVKYIETARKLAEDAKQSTAFWDLEELSLRLARQEAKEVSELIQHIYRSHINEPGVGEGLYRLLGEAGLVGPNGEIMMPGAPAATSSIIGAGESTSGSESKLWTPDGGAGGTEKKSSLWVPE